MRIITTADDYGLTRGNTDSILSAVDAGGISNVSVFANGEALDYALEEFSKRSPKLSLSVHLNLTEGPALSPRQDIALLVDGEGFFRYSPGRLLLRYMCALPTTKQNLRQQVAREIRAQLEAVSARLSARGLSISGVDGHQHIHMLPFVFDALTAQRVHARIRMPAGPLYAYNVPSLFVVAKRCVGWAALRLFVARNRRRARLHGLTCNDFFIGFLFSGRMTLGAVQAGLGSLPKSAEDSALCEIIFHPGRVHENELTRWREGRCNSAWHTSSWRNKERELLTSPQLKDVISGRIPAGDNLIATLFRFGISGCIAATVDLSVLYIVTSFFGIWYLYSAIIAFLCAFMVSFVLQKSWTFRGRHRHHVRRQVPYFFILQGSNLAVNTLLMYVFVDWFHLWYLGAQFFLLATIAIWSFFAMQRFVFAPHQDSPVNA